MLLATDLACIRGDRCLFRNLSFDVQPGQLLRVEGANGVGKTSLLRLLAGLALPAQGAVLWNGQSILKQRENFAAALLYMGHLPALKEELTACENLRMHAHLAGLPVDEATISQALARFGLHREARLPTKLLSAGQRRRAGLARLLLSTHSPLWILDEPFTALDVGAIEFLSTVLAQHLESGGMSVITTHQEVAIKSANLVRLRLSA